MSKSTRATVALDKVGINFTLHSYDYDPDAERVGLQAAEALGVVHGFWILIPSYDNINATGRGRAAPFRRRG